MQASHRHHGSGHTGRRQWRLSPAVTVWDALPQTRRVIRDRARPNGIQIGQATLGEIVGVTREVTPVCTGGVPGDTSFYGEVIQERADGDLRRRHSAQFSTSARSRAGRPWAPATGVLVSDPS
jgi:hypothetical protein